MSDSGFITRIQIINAVFMSRRLRCLFYVGIVRERELFMFTVLYNIVITPLIYLMEMIFWAMYRIFGGVGVAIIGVSLAVNLLCLPLYRRADAIQTEQREKQKKMEKWTNHIREAFKGDERVMMQQAYYREQHYSPLSVFKNSISLLLQIPFFMAAYNYLSHLDLLNGTSFWFIKDLSKPDGLLTIGGVAINLLPILMTLINFVSSTIYTRGYKFKEKWQLYVIAIVFLVLLYNSPAGLVFYWTLNNLFSLLKNVFMRAVHLTKGQQGVALSLIGAAIFAFMIYRAPRGPISRMHSYLLGLAAFVLLSIPLVKHIVSGIKEKRKNSGKTPNRVISAVTGFIPKAISRCDKKIFILSAAVLSVLIGALIPLSVISASPVEFLNLGDTKTPFEYILHTLPVAIGFFIMWLGVFYLLSNEKGKKLFSFFTLGAAIIAVVDFMFISKSFGTVDTSLNYAGTFMYTAKDKLINLAVIVGIVTIVSVLLNLKPSVTKALAAVLLIGTIGISVYSAIGTKTELGKVKVTQTETLSNDGSNNVLHFSTEGKNVVVIMLDRAMGDYVPYIFNEKPELKEQFSGFTYYPNTISHGFFTVFGAPELFGGYEYTPVEMNKRSDVPMVEKHNEALLTLPVIFGENGYDVTVTDPPYANYGWEKAHDYSPYYDYDYIDVYGLEGGECLSLLSSEDLKLLYGLDRNRSFYYYSLMKASPVFAARFVYDEGKYMSLSFHADSHIDETFLGQYAELANLENLTDIQTSDGGNLTLFQSSMTHTPSKLDLPDYTLPTGRETSAEPDMSLYTLDGRTADVYKDVQPYHYHVNMMAYLKLGEWFDYLKEQGVYDNTRIIIASDHGRDLYQFKDMIYDNGTEDTSDDVDLECFRPVYMFKDFGDGEGFKTDTTFMTIADTPTLATKDVIDDPVNPFTGKEINNDEKTAHDQYITSCEYFQPSTHKYVFKTDDYDWYSVHDDVFDMDNWKNLGPANAEEGETIEQ